MPTRRAVLMTRQAISPRLAMRIFSNMRPRPRRRGARRPCSRTAPQRIRKAKPAGGICREPSDLSSGREGAGGTPTLEDERDEGFVGAIRLGDDRLGDAHRGPVRAAAVENGGEPGGVLPGDGPGRPRAEDDEVDDEGDDEVRKARFRWNGAVEDEERFRLLAAGEAILEDCLRKVTNVFASDRLRFDDAIDEDAELT